MKLKRLTSLLIAGCMMVSMAPVSAVTAFAEESTGTSVSEDAETTKKYEPYNKLVKAIADAKDGDTVKLTEDVDLEMTLAISKTLTLDLNGHELHNTSDLWDKVTDEQGNNWSLVSVREGGDLTITGNGTLRAKSDDCYAVDVQDGAKLTIENGEFIGNIHAVYVETGEAYIKGGHYSVQQKFSVSLPDEYVLNLLDGHRENGTAKLIVTGGEFEKFNPANCYAEGAGTNFCASGYTTKKVGDNYVVEAPNYILDTKVNVDEDPKDKNPENPNEGTIGEPVEIAVTAEGEGVQYIKKLTLDFGKSAAVVSDVSITNGEKTVSLKEKYNGNYKNMSIAELEALLAENTDKSAAEENGVATQADEPAAINFKFLVTYTDNGTYRVNVVFEDAGENEVKTVPATVQIGAKSEDDTSDTSSSGDGAGAVVAGVVIGTGVAALTYHIGTEIYAKQVLGAGVAVPKTREEVALKAWELAGKPAVAAEGETLSDAEQAERWVVETGLMKNDANGSFNGQKRMLKLVALRTLDAAKKLG